MIDIEKMQAEFDEKLKNAKLCNELEEKTGIKNISKSHNFFHQNGVEFDASYGFGCGGGHHWDHKEYPTIGDIGKILKQYPVTQPFIDKKENWSGDYYISSERPYADSYGTLKIMYIHQNIQFDLYLRIDAYPDLKDMFNIAQRTISSSELSTYKPMYRGHLNRNCQIPRYMFKDVAKDKYILYEGGHVKLLDNGKAQEIIDLIKSHAI